MRIAKPIRLFVFLQLMFSLPLHAVDMNYIVTERINEFQAETAGIYYEAFDGTTFTYQPDLVMHAASTMKVPVMMEVYRQVESGKLKLGQKILVKNEFTSIFDGSKYSQTKEDDSDQELYDQIGKKVALSFLLERMINRSSNLATNIIIEIVDAKNVMALMEKIGAKDMTVLRGVEDNKAYDAGMNNTTSARALALCLKAILDPKMFRESSRKQMFDILLSQKFKEIGESIQHTEPGLQVASKDGFITGIQHDAAIIRDRNGNDTILVILTKGVQDEKQAEEFVRVLADDIWEFFHK